MAVTLHFGDRAPHTSAGATAVAADASLVPDAPLAPDAPAAALFLPAEELPAATGWELKPEGACLGEVCVPLPAAARRPGLVDVAALARALGRPLVHEGDTWIAGEPAAARAEALASLAAPDFELPDLAGRLHRLSQYRGHKVLVLSWASW